MTTEVPPTEKDIAKVTARDLRGRGMAKGSPGAAYYNEVLASIEGSAKQEAFIAAYLRNHMRAGVEKAVDMALEDLRREEASAYPKPRRAFSWQ